MTNQPQLLDPSGVDIPGPVFKFRPGWGGKLSNWFQDNFYILIFRLVVLAAVILIISSLIRAWQTGPLATSNSPISKSQETFKKAASAGQGMTDLAVWAVNFYSSLQVPRITLTSAQHLYAVDTLARKAGWRWLEVGEQVEFSADDIATVIEQAKSLSPAQRSAWARYLRSY